MGNEIDIDVFLESSPWCPPNFTLAGLLGGVTSEQRHSLNIDLGAPIRQASLEGNNAHMSGAAVNKAIKHERTKTNFEYRSQMGDMLPSQRNWCWFDLPTTTSGGLPIYSGVDTCQPTLPAVSLYTGYRHYRSGIPLVVAILVLA